MAKDHLCAKSAAMFDAEVAFGHDKGSKTTNFIFIRKPCMRISHFLKITPIKKTKILALLR